jgi:hypothetical protein
MFIETYGIKMNNKPVAWMNAHTHTGHLCGGGFLMTKMQDYIPLYTHPAKHDLGIAEAIGFEKGYQAGLKKASEK